jgi:hypothetical protein
MGEIGAEPIHPEADTFVTDIDTAFVEKVFNVPQGQRESDIHEGAVSLMRTSLRNSWMSRC